MFIALMLWAAELDFGAAYSCGLSMGLWLKWSWIKEHA
jgi:hypothetical protein